MADNGLKPVLKIRQQLLKDATVGTLATDTQKVFDQLPPVGYKVFTSTYTEPMTLGTLSEQPMSIELVRIQFVVGQELPVKCGGLVHFVYKTQQGGAIITNIDGLTPNPNVQYVFTFRITYEAG